MPSDVVRLDISRAERDFVIPERVPDEVGRDTSRIDLERANEVDGTD